MQFSKEQCKVFYQNKLAMIGRKSDKTGLCHLPVNSGTPESDAHIEGVGDANETSSITHGTVISICTLPFKQQQLK